MPNNTAGPKGRKITHAEFFQLVEAFKTHREDISKKCRSRVAIGLYLHEKTGLTVSDGSVIELLEVSGVKLEDVVNRAAKSIAASVAATNRKILTDAVAVVVSELALLAESLGYATSADFKRLVRSSPKPVSVSSLPNPRDLTVANGR